MKNKLTIITTVILLVIISFVFYIEGFETFNNSISIKSINNISYEEMKNIKKTRKQSLYDLIEIKYENNRIPYDSNEDIYYFSKYNKEYVFDILYSDNTIVKSISDDKKNLLKIIAYNKDKYKIYNICLSEFAIINISLEDKNINKENLISEDYAYGNISIFDNEKYKNKLDIVNESAKFKIRGLSSANYDKKSYSIQFIDSKSGEKKLVDNLLGFDSNNMFALNSLYEDDSKIRDILSLNSWKYINDDISSENEVNMKYVEVIINNQYYGLYGFGEIVNEYKIKADNENSIIYKINDHRIPTLESFNNNLLVNDSIEIVYPDRVKNGNWYPIKNLIDLNYYSKDNKFNENILKYIDIDNCVNYFILTELTYNADGLWKNNILKYDYINNKLIKVPWDFDLTWGSYWDETNELSVNYNNELSTMLLCNNKTELLSGYLEQRLWKNNVGDFREKVAEKWKELRCGFLETEAFVDYANELYNKVTDSGAREREHKRWPNGGYSKDNEFIETFIRQRLEYLDTVFLKY